MAAPVPANLAAALRFGPQTQTSLRRSQYLSDALRQIQASGGSNIQSGGELAAKLLATAILQRGSNKADKSALTALRSDQDSETASLVSALRPKAPSPPTPPAMPQIAAPAPAPAPQPQPVAAEPQPMPSAQPQQASAGLDPQIDAIVRTVIGEAQGEDPVGQAAVANVIINRSKRAGKAPMDVVFEPGQFEPWGNPTTRAKLESLSPSDPLYQRVLQNIGPALQGQDVTGGADHFYSPTAQSAAGRAPPKWDNGSGVDHGKHRFFSLGYGGQGAHRREQTPANMFEQPQPDARPVQIAMNGQVDPSMLTPSAPAGPNGGGAAPAAAIPPQAAAAGANVAWPLWSPTPQQLDYAEALARDPRTHDQGIAELRKLQAKMAEPAEAEIVNMNGVPFYVSKTPGAAGQPVMIPIPQGAMTQTQSAQQAGLPNAPQGAYVQRDPYGNLKEAPFAPPAGYNATPQGYAPIAGGPADPTRPQAPTAGYQYMGGSQAPIPGGPADPASMGNIVTNEGKLRDDYEGQIKGYRTARDGFQKVIQAAKTGTPAGDLALVFGYMKTLDPTSTVREGEQASVQNSGTIDQSIMNTYNKLLGGTGMLLPEQRAQFVDSARRQFSVYETGAKAINDRYTELAKSYNFNPSRIVQNFAPVEPAGNQPPAPNPALIDNSGRPPGWSRQLPPAQLATAKRVAGSNAPGGSRQNPKIVQSQAQYQSLKPGEWFIDDDGAIVQKGSR